MKLKHDSNPLTVESVYLIQSTKLIDQLIWSERVKIIEKYKNHEITIFLHFYVYIGGLL